MFYTINENFVDNFFRDISTTKPTNRLHSQFEATTLEDGKQKVTVNTIGHNPKEITVDVQKQQEHDGGGRLDRRQRRGQQCLRRAARQPEPPPRLAVAQWPQRCRRGLPQRRADVLRKGRGGARR